VNIIKVEGKADARMQVGEEESLVWTNAFSQEEGQRIGGRTVINE